MTHCVDHVFDTSCNVLCGYLVCRWNEIDQGGVTVGHDEVRTELRLHVARLFLCMVESGHLVLSMLTLCGAFLCPSQALNIRSTANSGYSRCANMCRHRSTSPGASGPDFIVTGCLAFDSSSLCAISAPCAFFFREISVGPPPSFALIFRIVQRWCKFEPIVSTAFSMRFQVRTFFPCRCSRRVNCCVGAGRFHVYTSRPSLHPATIFSETELESFLVELFPRNRKGFFTSPTLTVASPLRLFSSFRFAFQSSVCFSSKRPQASRCTRHCFVLHVARESITM